MPVVQPGARVLWCLRRRLSDIRCVIYSVGTPVEVQVLQDRDVVLTEMFPEEALALRWAEIFGDRLKQQGWHDAASRAVELDENGGRHAP
jgi:hypothetical protein